MLDKKTNKLVFEEVERMKAEYNNKIDFHVEEVERYAREWREEGTGLHEMYQHASVARRLESKVEVLQRYLNSVTQGDR